VKIALDVYFYYLEKRNCKHFWNNYFCGTNVLFLAKRYSPPGLWDPYTCDLGSAETLNNIINLCPNRFC